MGQLRGNPARVFSAKVGVDFVSSHERAASVLVPRESSSREKVVDALRLGPEAICRLSY
jgi:hypothetical protein